MTALVAQQAGFVVTGPVGSLDSYIAHVSQIPILSKEEEVSLATRFRSEADLDAARQLVLSHLRFVVHFARSYMGYGLPLGDLIQEGNLGLMKAVKRLDPDVGVRQVSFAVHWIRAQIHEYVLCNWRLVKVATTKAQRKLFFNLRKMKKNLAWLTAEETEAVARELGVEVADVREMERRLSGRDMSFDPTPEHDEAERHHPALYLPAGDSDPAMELEREEWDQDSRRRLTGAMQELDERSRSILQRRWMAEEKATLQKLAEEYSISVERVRQLENNAMRKLKSLLLAD